MACPARPRMGLDHLGFSPPSAFATLRRKRGQCVSDVFISYSRDNQEVVRRLAEAVKALGYDVWWDDQLPPHLAYGDVISQKVGGAKAAIVVWSA